MADETLVNVPFDQPTGSTEAPDVGPNNLPVELVGAEFIRGRAQQAAHFEEGGRAEIKEGFWPFDQAATYCFWAKADRFADGPNYTWLLYKFPGEEDYLYLDLGTDLSSWTYIAILQEVDRVSVSVDSEIVASEIYPPEWGIPTGFCILNDGPTDGSGLVSIQDFNAYLGTDGEIVIPPVPMDLQYSINGIPFQNFKVTVSESNGLLEPPAMKDPKTFEWDEYHGIQVDLSRPRFQARTIVLECFIEAPLGKDQFFDRVNNFMREFTKPWTQRLRLDVVTDRPLVWEVYCPDTINPKKKWSDDLMVGTFTLTLIEPQPVKRVLRGSGTVNVSFTSPKIVDIAWGDGTFSRNLYGNVNVSHTFAGGEYLIVIMGVIEQITNFNSNAPILWSKIPS